MTLSGFLIDLYMIAVLFANKFFVSSFHLRALPLSTLPLAGILINFRETRITFHAIKKSPLRRTAYSASVVLFLVCLLSSVGLVPITRTTPGHVSRPQFYICLLLTAANILFIVVNMGIVVLDANRRHKGLPL